MGSRKKIYILVHAWLSSIQKGIQAAHVLQGWKEADEDLSIILLETSKSQPAKDLHDAHMLAIRTPFVFSNWKVFRESDECFNENRTAVGFIIDPNLSNNPHQAQLDFLGKFKLAN